MHVTDNARQKKFPDCTKKERCFTMLGLKPGTVHAMWRFLAKLAGMITATVLMQQYEYYGSKN